MVLPHLLANDRLETVPVADASYSPGVAALAVPTGRKSAGALPSPGSSATPFGRHPGTSGDSWAAARHWAGRNSLAQWAGGRRHGCCTRRGAALPHAAASHPLPRTFATIAAAWCTRQPSARVGLLPPSTVDGSARSTWDDGFSTTRGKTMSAPKCVTKRRRRSNFPFKTTCTGWAVAHYAPRTAHLIEYP